MKVLADTSCWIEFFRPRGDVQVRSQMLRWLAVDALVSCGPVRAEIARGVRQSEAPRVTAAFEALPHLQAEDADWHAVETRVRQLAAAGRTVPLLDLYVAVLAHRNEAVLAHKDAHFRAIAEVLPLQQHDFIA